MHDGVKRIVNTLLPPVPASVREELSLLRYRRLQSQIPMLYLVLAAVIVTAATYAPLPVEGPLSLVLPYGILAACIARSLIWLQRSHNAVSVAQAARMIRSAIIISTLIAIGCSFWCVLAWQEALPADRDMLPLFMAMGTLSSAYCLSNIRVGAYANLIVGIPPISLALLMEGDGMDMAAAASLLVACAFLIRMIHQQHQHLVDLLLLQNRMEELAYTVSLTGLLNRRAFYERLDSLSACATPSQPLAVILIDLDGFKPVNDRFGHAVGDALLKRVAERLIQPEHAGMVARLGGDEFALLVPNCPESEVAALTDRMLSALITPFEVDGARVRVGASAGFAIWPGDGQTVEELMVAADMALYTAKGGSRGRSRTQPVRKALVIG